MKHLLLVLTVLLTNSTHAQKIFNGDFEIGAAGWTMDYDTSENKTFLVTPDSTVKHTGRYAMRLECSSKDYAHGRLTFSLPNSSFEGDEVTLRGYIKGDQLSIYGGGLFIELIDTNGKVYIIDDMDDNAITGASDWKQFTIRVPYDCARVRDIKVGGWLSGSGKLWIDDLELLVNGKTLENTITVTRPYLGVFRDTVFRHASGIADFTLTKQRLTNLSFAGQFWAFLKYHHPDIASGKYNWDAELFRLLPDVLAAKNNAALSAALETYLDKLPTPDNCKNCQAIAAKSYIMRPDYGSLLDGKILSTSLTKKLEYIRDNRNTRPNYYVTVASTSNPDLSNEDPYAEMAYPDAGYRLLSLFRYWGIINYYFPYRDIIGEDWAQVLNSSLADFVYAKNEIDYDKALLKIIARIHDTHANIYDGNKGIDSFRGKYVAPFKAIFAEGKLVITDLHTDTLDVREILAVGDIIEKIDDVPVKTLVEKYRPYSPASNDDVVLRNLPWFHLLRSNNTHLKLSVNRQGQRFEYAVPMGDVLLTKRDTKKEQYKAYTVPGNNIGLVYPGKYMNDMLPDIKKAFSRVKGIIIDMRCYPSNFMPYTFGNYIKQGKGPFARFSKGAIDYPGAFQYFKEYCENGATDAADSLFKGPVVVIVNSTTQSQAEFTTMAFQSASNVKVLGSTTAGADGNVSFFELPGGIQTLITGLGVFYPDNKQTQRVGVKIDYTLYPTIKGIRAGRDELMEKAVQMIEKGF